MPRIRGNRRRAGRNICRAIRVDGCVTRRTRIAALLLIGALAVGGGLAAWRMGNAAYDSLTIPTHVGAGLSPRLTGSDAYRITLGYLAAASAEAEPGTVVAPGIHAMWAVTANDAAGLDGCIPTGKGTGIVWVTKGAGTYLNLADHAWSSTTPAADDPAGACSYPAPAGTIVIDDATGEILGVYPDSGSYEPHPSPKVPLPGS